MEAKGKKRPDRRHARTERRIREAFTELVMEKNVDKITIKELAERADIDRKTFYLHYSSVWDVLEEIQGEILEKVDPPSRAAAGSSSSTAASAKPISLPPALRAIR